MLRKGQTMWNTLRQYGWKAVTATAGLVGDLISKNLGLTIGAVRYLLKKSKNEKAKKLGDKIEDTINDINSVTKGNEIKTSSGFDISKQISIASNIIGNKEQPQVFALALPTAPYVPYNKNLGGTNFQRYHPRRKKYKRTIVNTSHEVVKPKFAVKGYR